MQKVGGFLGKRVGFFFNIICLKKYPPLVRLNSDNLSGIANFKENTLTQLCCLSLMGQAMGLQREAALSSHP